MAPLMVWAVAWLVFRGLGGAGWMPPAESWAGALRFAFVVMFAFTGISHFLPWTRLDLVQMVPPQLPEREFLVSVTGIAEFAGAVGLLAPSLAQMAAYGLMALLVLMFPANIYAARERMQVAGRPATALTIRTPLQLFWIYGLWWVAQEGITR